MRTALPIDWIKDVILHPDGANVARVFVYKPGLTPDGEGVCAMAFVGTRSKRPRWDYYFPDEKRLGRAVSRLFATIPRKPPAYTEPYDPTGEGY